MPFDREDTLKKAEKLLRQGRLDAAIVEYARVVEDQPTDWATTNMLGDLYVRAGQNDKAAGQYSRIAEHFMKEGFYPKAAALYKKLLKLNPDEEATQLNLAEISHKQGLLADAKARLSAVAARRRSRGDHAGAASIVVRLGSVDPADFDARIAAARTVSESGDEQGAAARFRGIYSDLLAKGRQSEALDALREAVRLDPHDQDGRVALAKASIAAGDLPGARAYLDLESAGDDTLLLTALLEVELKSGSFDRARQVLSKLLGLGRDERQQILHLAWTTLGTSPEAAHMVIETVVDAAAAANEYQDAATMLQEFVARVPNHIHALLKLIEISVDGGLEATMYDAQAQLADAYLTAGQAAEARVIAEDLVAREPWERVHIDRFRRALVMLKVSDPDTVIADRLSGHAPFMWTDPFASSFDAAPVVEEASLPPEDIPPEAARPAEVSPPAVADFSKPVEPVTSAAARKPAETDIDLADALDEYHSSTSGQSETPDRAGESAQEKLEEAFKHFRSEANRQTIDQSVEHMHLARTYLEMGLADDAVESLKTASRAPRFRFEAASLLGRIYTERGEHAQAIEWLERAAEAPAPTEEEGRALLYDLGALVERSGETARALAIYLELQSEAGEYRDVAARVERLARVETGG